MLVFYDRARQVKHNIEPRLLFLHCLWKHEFEIIPILVGGMGELLYAVDETYGFDPDAFFLVRGDLSPFGKTMVIKSSYVND